MSRSTKNLKIFCKRVFSMVLAMALLLTGGAFSNIKFADAAGKVKVKIYGLTGYTNDSNGNAVPTYKLAYKGYVTDNGCIYTCQSGYNTAGIAVGTNLYAQGMVSNENELGISGNGPVDQSVLLPLTGGKYAQYVIKGTTTRVFTASGSFANAAKSNLLQLEASDTAYEIIPTFTRETISVSFNGNGGTLADDTTYTKNKYDTWACGGWPANPTREGYYFAGWSDSSGNMVNPSAQIPADATNQVLVANWSLNNYTATLYRGTGIGTVSFDSDRTIVNSRTMTASYGQQVFHVATVMNDYEWDGWYYADANGNSTGELYSKNMLDSYIATSSVSLVAVAKAKEYEAGYISVDTNGATSYGYQGHTLNENIQNVKIKTDNSTGLSAPNMFYVVDIANSSSENYIYDMKKTGYTLKGFEVTEGMKLSDGNEISCSVIGNDGYYYTFSTVYGEGVSGYGLSKSYSQDYTTLTKDLLSGATAGVRAQWTPNTYTITFKPNDGTGSMEDMSMTYDVPKKLNTCYFTKTGYECVGWAATEAKADKGIVDYSLNDYVSNLTSVDGNTVTLYAVWKEAEYDLTLLAGEGIKSVTVKYGSNQTKTGKTALITGKHNSTASYSCEVEEGYTFDGWYENNTKLVSAEPTITLTKDTTLTAVATYNGDCYIEFIGNGHTGGEMEVQTATKKVATTLDANGYTKTGYSFVGWGDSLNATQVKYEDKASITPTKDMELYAIWKANTSKLSFKSNFSDNSEMSAISYTYGTDGVFTVPESELLKRGYHIKNWVVFEPDFINSASSVITKAGGVEKYFGNDFAGWNAMDMSGESAVVAIVEEGDNLIGVLTEDVVYVAYPQWEVNTYNVSFNVPEGAEISKPVTSYAFGAEVKLPTEVEYEDTVFMGWYDNAKCKGDAVTKIGDNEIGDKTFTGLFMDPETGDIVFPGDLTEEEEKEIEDSIITDCPYMDNLELNGGKILLWVENWNSDDILLPVKNNVVKDGHEFAGWYDNEDLEGEPVTSMKKEDLDNGDKVYAAWGVADYTISYNVPTGAAIKDEVKSYTYGEGATLPTEVNYKNAVFLGWYDNAKCQGEKVLAVSKTDSGNKEFTGLFVNPETGEIVYPGTEDMTDEEKKNIEDKIQDVVDGCPYMENLVLNGGTVLYWVEDWDSDDITLPVAYNVVKDGCEFVGWYKASDFSGDPVLSMKKNDLDAGYKVYAKWATVSTNTPAPGATDTPSVSNAPSTSEQPGTSNAPSTSDAPSVSNAPSTSDAPSVSEQPGASAQPSPEVSKAPGSDCPYMGNLVVPSDTVVKWDEDWTQDVIKLPTDVTKPGYTFDGWYVTPDFTGKPVTELSKVDLDNGVLVYGKLVPNTYTVTFDLNGGTAVNPLPVSVTHGTNLVLPTALDVSRTDYEFAGWCTNADLTGDVVKETGTNVVSNLVYYAKWNLKKNAEITTSNGLIYRISGTNTAALIGTKKRNIKKLTVPNKVTLTSDGVTKTYKVNRVKADAFAGCKQLTTVTIGKNVTTIGAYAFKNCKKLKIVNIKSVKLLKICEAAFSGDKKLKKITIKSKKLNKVGKRALKNINKKCVIKVPENRVKKYKKLFKGKGQKKTVKIKK